MSFTAPSKIPSTIISHFVPSAAKSQTNRFRVVLRFVFLPNSIARWFLPPQRLERRSISGRRRFLIMPQAASVGLGAPARRSLSEGHLGKFKVPARISVWWWGT